MGLTLAAGSGGNFLFADDPPRTSPVSQAHFGTLAAENSEAEGN